MFELLHDKDDGQGVHATGALQDLRTALLHKLADGCHNGIATTTARHHYCTQMHAQAHAYMHTHIYTHTHTFAYKQTHSHPSTRTHTQSPTCPPTHPPTHHLSLSLSHAHTHIHTDNQSCTAANWVSFDFNVAYSSRWGYSLINTLKLKKKNHVYTIHKLHTSTLWHTQTSVWRDANMVCVVMHW